MGRHLICSGPLKGCDASSHVNVTLDFFIVSWTFLFRVLISWLSQLEFLFLQSELTDLDFCNFRFYFWWFLTVVDRMVIFVLACRPPASAKRERILNWQLWYNTITDIIEVSSSSSSYSFFIGPESDHWLCLSLTHSLTNWLTHSLLFSKLYWCDPGVWRCQLKTCWCCNCCWWWSCWQQFVPDLEAEVWSKN